MKERLSLDEEFEAWFGERMWYHENTAKEQLWLSWLMLSGAGVGVKVIKGALDGVIDAVEHEYGD